MDNLKIPMENVGEVSDGFHTFNELYQHRVTLYIALLKSLKTKYAPDIWRSQKHFNGSVWEGWFILGIHKKKGEQITYHIPIDNWDETNFAEILERAPEFDGHTPDDVLERLKKL